MLYRPKYWLLLYISLYIFGFSFVVWLALVLLHSVIFLSDWFDQSYGLMFVRKQGNDALATAGKQKSQQQLFF